jgi:hypothetical protein
MGFLRSEKFGFGKSSKSSKQTDTDTDSTSTRPETGSNQQESRSRSNIGTVPDEEDDYIPKSEAEAREHIDKIRAAKGLQGTNSNTANYNPHLLCMLA